MLRLSLVCVQHSSLKYLVSHMIRIKHLLKCQPTKCHPVSVGTRTVFVVQLCINGLWFAAFFPVESEEPSATGSTMGTSMKQPQGTIPYDSQHGLIPFLDELTRLWRKNSSINLLVTRQ